jgi:hypothetical protein
MSSFGLLNAGLVVVFGLFSVEYKGDWHCRQSRISYVCPGILGEMDGGHKGHQAVDYRQPIDNHCSSWFFESSVID